MSEMLKSGGLQQVQVEVGLSPLLVDRISLSRRLGCLSTLQERDEKVPRL